MEGCTERTGERLVTKTAPTANGQWATMGDAAYAANLDGTSFNAVGGYLVSPNAAHPWTTADWEGVPGPKLPIWVKEEGGNGADEGEEALRQLFAMNVKPCYIAVDMEEMVDKTYCENFYKVCNNTGYKVLIYGSASTVFQNPQCNGYWVADYIYEPFMYNHPGTRATQWTDGELYDQSTVKPWILKDFWV